MSYEQEHRKLISGQCAGAAAGLLRSLLRIASVGYAIVVAVRNFLYSHQWLKVHRVDAAVISIGNITVGGTGKTPLVLWLCRWMSQRHKCTILTRGYKSGTGDIKNGKDEVALLAEGCPQAKVIVNPDRVAGADEAITKFGANVLIMDDGFQHRRLARDLDIVAVDATEPFGYGKLLPAGLLREPASSLKRAHAVVMTRCDQVDGAELDELEKKLHAENPELVIARSIHAPVSVKYSELSVIPANAGIQKDAEKMDSCLRRNDRGAQFRNDGGAQLKGKRIFAFCGIGNPEAFLETIKSLGGELAGSKVYADHYRYTEHCLADIYRQAENSRAEMILTTQKDWTKISGLRLRTEGIPLACLVIEIKFVTGQDELTSLIESALAGRISPGG